jgi:capsid protein
MNALDRLREVIPLGSVLQVKQTEVIPFEMVSTTPNKYANAFNGMWGAGGYAPIVNTIWNGEKNFGELGPVLKYIVDHDRLGRRAWQLDMDNETAHTAIREKNKWMLGPGLRLDAEPQEEVLKNEGIKLDVGKFNDQVESYWKVYVRSKESDYAKRANLQKIAKRAVKNKSVRGDVLVVLRVEDNGNVTTQLIDGEHVATPPYFSPVPNTNQLVDNYIGYDYMNPETNRRVRWGVEIDDNGEPVAYHVRTGVGLEFKTIKAYDSLGFLRAYLYVGEEYRLDNLRGIPEITPSMETTKQLDDYSAAMVSSAVERARLAYFIEHEKGTDQIDPRTQNLAEMVGAPLSMDVPVDVNGNILANTIATSSQKQTYNLPPGAKIAAPESKMEARFEEFYDTRRNSTFATMGIAPEIAKQLYTGSYSASRASTNGQQYTIDIDREDTGDQFYAPIYILQLHMWICLYKVDAPGYIDALMSGNTMVLNAYRYANWLGNPVPQIDKYKEVMAARAELGTNFDHVPLNSVEKATRDLGNGNYKANVKQMGQELKDAAAQGLKPVEKAPVQNKVDDTDKEDTPPPKKKKKKTGAE